MSHPDAETLALLAEGKLPRDEARAVLAHLDGCADCFRAVQGANADLAAPRTRSTLRYSAAIAAAAVLVIFAIAYFRENRDGYTPAARLIELLPSDARTVEPRLSGGFPWAPYRGPARSPDVNDPRQFRLVGAAGEILEEARRDGSPEAQHAAGTALVVIGRPQDAIARLRAAAEKDVRDAALWNDLGAAEYSAALQMNQPARFPEALAAFDRALAIDERHAEALFNRALTLERLGLRAGAREAWERYLRLDRHSRWAGEAREHLRQLPAATGELRFRGDQPALERAALANDRAGIEAFVRRHPQASRTFGEAEYLGQWAASDSAGRLIIARAIGDALARISGETLLRDAVAAIDRADAKTRRTIAEAHLAYRRGRLAYSRQAPEVAEPELRRAAEAFARGGSPMALVARYFAANARFDQNDVAAARRELEALLIEADRHPAYKALGAQLRWELALCLMNDDDWSGALPLLDAAQRTFHAIGETSNRGFLDGLQGDALTSLGRPDEAWAARIRSFDALSSEDWGDRLAISLGAAVRAELRAGRLAAARSLSAVEMDALRARGNDFTLANALVRAALLDAELGDARAAAAKVGEAANAASRLIDPAMRARSLADVQFARGAVLLRTDAHAAAALLDQAIDGYVKSEAPVFLAETRLLRARAALRLGEGDAALREIEHGIAAYERHLEPTVLDAGRALYEEAIRLTLERGDVAAAFTWSERALGGPADDLRIVQSRLRGTGAAVLELAFSHGEVIAFLIKSGSVDVVRRVHSYDVLLRGLDLGGVTQLIIVADPRLDAVALAAQQLVDRVAVAFAPSASVLRSEPPRQIVSIAAVGVAARDLPSSRQELAELVRLYRHSIDTAGTFASVAAARADVIHISGHADVANDATLVFRGERVSSRRIASARMHGRPLVVLAACETLRASRTPQRRALSLGEGFLAAGARGVIGTLAPIPDNDARAIFGRIHRHLASGRSAPEAVRLAQLESRSVDRSSAWRAVALLTSTIEVKKEHS